MVDLFFINSRKSRLGFLAWLVLLLPLLTGCESTKKIVNGLDEREANEIIVFLATKNIDAQKIRAEEEGAGAQVGARYDISVNEEDAIQAMAALNQAGLPRRRGQNLLGIFQNVGLVPTEMTERIRYQAGLAEQIASTIRKIDGILDAEVQLSFPEDDPLNPGQRKGDITASIYVKHSGVLDDPNAHLANRIRRLVASSVTGLKYDNVNLIPDKARFSDLPAGALNIEEEKQWVQVWNMVIAKESLARFRLIFFTFSAIIVFGILSLIWILWKVYPLLRKHGGFKELFHLKPIKGNGQPSKADKKAEKDVTKAEKKVESGKTPEEQANAEADFEGDINFEIDEEKK
jgi:type III secretion protein J